MKIGSAINKARERLVDNLRGLRAEKQKAQALIAELNPLIDAAQIALDEFDADIALIPQRLRNDVE